MNQRRDMMATDAERARQLYEVVRMTMATMGKPVSFVLAGELMAGKQWCDVSATTRNAFLRIVAGYERDTAKSRF